MCLYMFIYYVTMILSVMSLCIQYVLLAYYMSSSDNKQFLWGINIVIIISISSIIKNNSPLNKINLTDEGNK